MENTDARITGLVKTILTSVGLSMGIGTVLLLCCAAGALSSEDPTAMLTPLSLMCLAVSSLVCGVLSARLVDGWELPEILIGLVSGGLMSLFLFFLTVIPIDGYISIDSTKKLLCHLAVAVLSAIGAYVGRRRRKSRRNYAKPPKKVKRRTRRR